MTVSRDDTGSWQIPSNQEASTVNAVTVGKGMSCGTICFIKCGFFWSPRMEVSPAGEWCCHQQDADAPVHFFTHPLSQDS